MGGRGGPARNNMSAGILAINIQGDGWRAALAVHRAMTASIGFIVYSYQLHNWIFLFLNTAMLITAMSAKSSMFQIAMVEPNQRVLRCEANNSPIACQFPKAYSTSSRVAPADHI
jgi:hypothetical protein